MNLTSLRPMSRMRLIAAGFGLIELMIGILIGTLLLLGLTQVFSTTRNAYQTSEGVARAQESSRFAMDFLSRDLRMAGHQGCVNDVSHFQKSTPEFYSHFLTAANRTALNWASAPYGEQFNSSLQGYEATNSAPGNNLNISSNTDPVPFGSAGGWTPALPAEVAGNAAGGVVIGSDVVTIRTFDTSAIPITAINTSSNPATITIPAQYSNLVTANSLYGIADCSKVSVFQATTSAVSGVFTVGVSGLNQSGFLAGENWATGNRQMFLYPLRSVVYFVGRATNGGPALYRINYSNGCGPTTTACQPEELVDGIENLQFLYGYDNHGTLPDGAIDTYWTASQVVNLGGAALGVDQAWRRVGAIRLGFISRSLDQAQTTNSITNARGPNNVAGTLVTTPDIALGSADSRLRIVYMNTVSVRNQLYGN